MKKLLYISAIAFLTACGSSDTEQQKDDLESVQLRKEIIEKFQGQMLEYCETSNEFMDQGLAALNSGTSADSIDQNIIDGIKQVERKVEMASKGFHSDMKLHGIKKEELQATHQSLTDCFNSLQEKHKKLKEAGVALK